VLIDKNWKRPDTPGDFRPHDYFLSKNGKIANSIE
jgi:hypothetical protein